MALLSLLFCLLFSCLLGQESLVAALPTVSVVGSKFFTSDGNQFFVKGIAYQLSPEDPLVDAAQCQRDASLMKELGANSIRVYHVDPEQNHDGCMTVFANAGIYLFLDLDTFSTMILGPSPSFNYTQYAFFARVLDRFHQYENLAGVFIGNEVLTQPDEAPAAPFVKAAASEIKAYRDLQKYRAIPVGYSAADISSLRPMLQDYLACGDEANTIDFFGLNAYEWCGSATYQTSGYENLQNMAEGYPRPIFFSETGCNVVRPRTWGDQAAIFGPQMSGTWSGAIAYEWIEEENNYGLIRYGPANAGVVRSGTPTPISPDFQNLKSAWANVSPSSIALSAYSPQVKNIKSMACPAYTSGAWEVDPNAALPTIGATSSYNPGSVPTAVVTTGAYVLPTVKPVSQVAAAVSGGSGSAGDAGSDGSGGSPSSSSSNAANAKPAATSSKADAGSRNMPNPLMAGPGQRLFTYFMEAVVSAFWLVLV